MDLLWLSLGGLKLCLITDWQARGGCRKRHRARLRCLGLPDDVFDAFLDPAGWTQCMRDGLASFLSLLVHSALCVQAGNGIFYQMSSPYLNYVGPPSSMVRLHACKGTSPVSRAYQHVVEHRRASSRGHQGSNHSGPLKVRAFSRLHPSHHMFWILRVGPLDHIRSLEAACSSVWRPGCNSSGVGLSKVSASRHSRASRSSRKQQSRRGQSASRCFNLHMHREHTANWLRASASHRHSQTVNRHRLQAEQLSQRLLTLTFTAGYRLAQDYMLVNGPGIGPVDIAHPLFVCWAGSLQTHATQYGSPCIKDLRPIRWWSRPFVLLAG